MAASLAAADEAAAPDPWVGKTRAEVIGLLGEPDRTKTDRAGVETLQYRFYRVAPDAPLGPAAVLLHVPGVGTVARVHKDRTRDADPMTTNPIVLDEEGRRTGGGMTPSRQSSSTYDRDTGEVRRSWDGVENPPVKGKATLKLVLDADGGVRSWSVSGKKSAVSPGG